MSISEIPSLNHEYSDLPLFKSGLLSHQDKISLMDTGADHAVTLNPKKKIFSTKC